jgi:galactokinase
MWPVEQRALDTYHQQFGREPEVMVSAPGRVNLIGEHTDYNGGFVLPCAIDRRVAATVGRCPGAAQQGHAYAADLDDTCLLAYTDAHPTGSWADHLLGVSWALTGVGLEIPPIDVVITGDVPQGARLSSSAAFEAAAALALTTLVQHPLPRRELALLCQQAENAFVGVHSGIMDQYAALLGAEGQALFIDCASLEVEEVPLALEASGLALLICDTRIKRGLGATIYNARRASCERAAFYGREFDPAADHNVGGRRCTTLHTGVVETPNL